MSVVGTVRFWNTDEGWGVIDSPETPRGCWIHYGKVAVQRFAGLETGQQMELEWEQAPQDGYDYRATRAWPLGDEPFDRYKTSGNPTPAFETSLTIEFDE